MLFAVEIWARSLEDYFAVRGVSLTFSDEGFGRLNRAVSINLSTADREADLIVWESGEGELILAGPDYSGPLQEHLEELTNPHELGATLAKMISGMGLK